MIGKKDVYFLFSVHGEPIGEKKVMFGEAVLK
jgi:hypothetical protein